MKRRREKSFEIILQTMPEGEVRQGCAHEDLEDMLYTHEERLSA
jgi:hypothetical protein